MARQSLEDVEEQDYSKHETDDPQRLWNHEEEENLAELLRLLCDDSHAGSTDALLGDSSPDKTSGHNKSGCDCKLRVDHCHLKFCASGSLGELYLRICAFVNPLEGPRNVRKSASRGEKKYGLRHFAL
jgi:hypothetical protein